MSILFNLQCIIWKHHSTILQLSWQQSFAGPDSPELVIVKPSSKWPFYLPTPKNNGQSRQEQPSPKLGTNRVSMQARNMNSSVRGACNAPQTHAQHTKKGHKQSSY